MEVMEFNAADVRPHLEWVAGEWRSPDSTGIPKTMPYAKGMHIEVSKLEGNSVIAWSPAIVAKTIWKNNLLVDYTVRKYYGTPLPGEIVDVNRVRPFPPRASEISFCINDEVEAFQGDCWWLGVITSVHPGFKYTFKSAHLGTEVEVNQRFLRLRYDWVDYQWEQVSKHEGEENSRKRARGSSAKSLRARAPKKTRTTWREIRISAASHINPTLMGREPEDTPPEEPHTQETEQPHETATGAGTKDTQTTTFNTLVVPGRRKKDVPKALQTPPVGPTLSTQEGADTVGTYPVVTPVAQPTPEASLDNQGEAAVETGIRPQPVDQDKSQLADKSGGEAGGSEHGVATQAEPATGPSAQLVTTSQTSPTLPAGGPGKTLGTARPALQTYSAELSRAKELWSEMLKKSSEFDTIMKDLELKASEQAKHIHEELSVQVRELEAKHSKQKETWRAVEAQRTEAVKVFQAQIQQLKQEKATLQRTFEAAMKREATLKHDAKFLNDKLNAKASEAEKLKSEAKDLRLQLNHTSGDLYMALRSYRNQVQDLAAAKSELKGLQDAVKPVVDLFKREGDDSRPLLEAVKELPTRVKEYVPAMAHSCVRQVLGLVHFLLPNADLSQVADGQPGYCTDEQLDRAEEDMEEIAKSFVSGLNFT